MRTRSSSNLIAESSTTPKRRNRRRSKQRVEPFSLEETSVCNLLTKTPRDDLTIIENKSKVCNSRNKPVVTKVSTNAPSSSTSHFPEIAALADAVKAMLLQKSSPLASVKEVEEIFVTCGGPHPYHQCLATDGNGFSGIRDKFKDMFQQPQRTISGNYRDYPTACKVLGFLDNSTSGNPTPSLDPILSTSSLSLTPFEGGDFILEEIKACLTNDSIPLGIDDDDFDPEGDLLLLEKLLNDDPLSPLPLKELHVEELKIVKSSIDDPPELELKDLTSHLEYAFLEGTDKLPVIIAKDLKEDEKVRLLKVLKSHKRVIVWKVSDIKGIDPQFCTHKILMEDDSKLANQHQRRVNPKIHEVIKKEVIKLLDARLIYHISNSP
ncbi:hypothetical protein Tco_1168594 [Tanacetum coccineum]